MMRVFILNGRVLEEMPFDLSIKGWVDFNKHK